MTLNRSPMTSSTRFSHRGANVWTALDPERQALLTRASEQEARRQAAQQRGDLEAAQAAERELRRLWSRYQELDGQRQSA